MLAKQVNLSLTRPEEAVHKLHHVLVCQPVVHQECVQPSHTKLESVICTNMRSLKNAICQ